MRAQIKALGAKLPVFHDVSRALIPVLVTGIQSAQVFGLKRLFPSRRRVPTGFL